METRSKQDTWNDHLRAWRASGLSQGAYCARHGLKVANLAYWLGKQRKAAARLTLVPLPLESGANGPILHGASGWRLELPAQAGPDWIADILRRLP
jgi:hypothetical protein